MKFAHLSCKGGTITVWAHKELQDFWGPKTVLPGVVWAKPGSNCYVSGICLLRVCGHSNAVFESAVVTALKSSTSTVWQAAVCVSSQSTITFRNSSFTLQQDAVPLAIGDSGSSVLLEQCNIQDNGDSRRIRDGGTVYASGGVSVYEGNLTILSSTVSGNSGVASAISAIQGAHVTIHGTQFTNNMAADGAAISAAGNSTVLIDGCTFTSNSALQLGGAIAAAGRARVLISSAPGKCRNGDVTSVRCSTN